MKSSPKRERGIETGAGALRRIRQNGWQVGPPSVTDGEVAHRSAVSTSRVPCCMTRFEESAKKRLMSLSIDGRERALLRGIAKLAGRFPEGRNLRDELALLRDQRMVVRQRVAIFAKWHRPGRAKAPIQG